MTLYRERENVFVEGPAGNGIRFKKDESAPDMVYMEIVGSKGGIQAVIAVPASEVIAATRMMTDK